MHHAKKEGINDSPMQLTWIPLTKGDLSVLSDPWPNDYGYILQLKKGFGELFAPVEVSAIKIISIRERSCPNRWVWQYAKKGHFTVKYAYHVRVSTNQLGESSSSSSLMRVSAKTWKGL